MDAYDVANVNGVLLVDNPEEQKVRLVYPFPTEDAHAEVRVVSTGEREPFKKPSGKDTQFVPLLQALGEIASGEEPLLEVIKEETKDFLVADVKIPAGQQVIRVHARQQLRPLDEAGRSFVVVLPVITAIPGQQAPETTIEGPHEIGARPIHGALWRRDPKVMIPYVYE